MRQAWALVTFIKIKYWDFLWKQRPFVFFLDKLLVVLFILLVPAQLIYFMVVGLDHFRLFEQIPLTTLWMICLGINISQLFYFPGLCAGLMGRGIFYRYPVSWNTLNSVRLLEGMGTKSFLLSCNILLLPMLLHTHHIVLFLACFLLILLGIRLASFIVYDVAWFLMGHTKWLALFITCIILAGWIVKRHLSVPPSWNCKPAFQTTAFNLTLDGIFVVLFFWADTHLFKLNTLNRKLI